MVIAACSPSNTKLPVVLLVVPLELLLELLELELELLEEDVPPLFTRVTLSIFKMPYPVLPTK